MKLKLRDLFWLIAVFAAFFAGSAFGTRSHRTSLIVLEQQNRMLRAATMQDRLALEDQSKQLEAFVTYAEHINNHYDLAEDDRLNADRIRRGRP